MIKGGVQRDREKIKQRLVSNRPSYTMRFFFSFSFTFARLFRGVKRGANTLFCELSTPLSTTGCAGCSSTVEKEAGDVFKERLTSLILEAASFEVDMLKLGAGWFLDV